MLTINHNGKTYSWIGDKWGLKDISEFLEYHFNQWKLSWELAKQVEKLTTFCQAIKARDNK